MKRLLALIVAGLLLFSCVSVMGAWENEQDIAVLLSELKIMQGDEDGNLRLDDSITRAEFAKVVIASSSFKDAVASGSRVSPFRDVPASHWAAPYIQLAVKNGFCKGYLDATFRPDNTILYEEAVTMLLQVLGYTQEDFGNSWPYGQLGIAKRIGLCDDLELEIGNTLTRRDVMRLCYHLLTTPPKGGTQDYIQSLNYTIVEDSILIATALEDSSVGSDKVLTSTGTYKINNSFSHEHIGRKGDAIIKGTNELVAFIPTEQTVDTYYVYQVLGGDIVVMNNGELTNLDLDDGLNVLYKSKITNLSSVIASLETGDVLVTYRNALGIMDYGAVYTDQLKGPFTYSGSAWFQSLGLTNPTITRNGSVISESQLMQNDILYYSKTLNQVWAYQTQVTGIYESASPNRDMPTYINVSGNVYWLEGTTALKKLATGGSFEYGDSVTLLLGKDGDVADVVSPAQMNTTVYGYLFSAGTKTFTTSGTNESYVDYSITVILPSGEHYEYAATKDYSSLENAVVKVSFSGGKAVVSRINQGSNISGAFTWGNKTLGNKKLSPNVNILEVSTLDSSIYGPYNTVFPKRLDGVTLKENQVLYSEQNTAGEITKLILLDATGDLYQYGMIKSVSTYSSQGMGVGGTYGFVIDGEEKELNSQKEFPVYAGSAAKFVPGSNSNSYTTIQPLTQLKGQVDQVTLTSIQIGSKTYPLSDKVTVYQKDYNNSYTVLPLSDVIGGTYRLTAYYDKPAEEGGRIRILLAE